MYPVATQYPTSLVPKFDIIPNDNLVPLPMAQYNGIIYPVSATSSGPPITPITPAYQNQPQSQSQYPHLSVAVMDSNTVQYTPLGGEQRQGLGSPLYSDPQTVSPVRGGGQQQQGSMDQANKNQMLIQQQQQQQQQQQRQQQHQIAMMNQRSAMGLTPVRPQLQTQGIPTPTGMSQLQLLTGAPSPSPIATNMQHAHQNQNRRASSPAAVYIPQQQQQQQHNAMYPSSAYARPVHGLQHQNSDYGVYHQQQQHQQHQQYIQHPSSAGQYPNLPGQHGWSSQPTFPSGVRMGMPGLPPHVIRTTSGSGGGGGGVGGGHGAGDEFEQEEEEFSGMIYDPYQVKHRKRTTPEQLGVLERAFDENNKPSAMARKQMAELVGMTPRSVQVWFQNRRQKRKALEKKRLEDEGQPEGENTPGPSNQIRYMPNGMPVPVRQTSAGSSEDNSPDIQPNQPVWTSMAPPPLSHHHSGPVPQYSIQRTPSSSSGSTGHSSMSGVQRGMPMLSQARRGSLPYPPPELMPPQQPRTISTSSIPQPQRTNIPMHVAMSLNNVRRASLPGNSAGIIQPGRQGMPGVNQGPPMMMHGAGRSHAAIQDYDEVSPLNYINTQVPSAGQQSSATMMQQSASSMTTGSGGLSGSSIDQALQGPLPSPGFSFGNANLDMANQPDMGGSGVLQENVSPLGSQSSASPLEYSANYSYYVPRGRMGSMASILSNVTATSTEGSASDWERHINATFPNGAIPQVQTPLVATELEKEKSLFPPGMAGVTPLAPWAHMGDRRASAPPELLQKFQTLDVEQLAQQSQLRRSPLNSSYVAPHGLSSSPVVRKATPGVASDLDSEVASIMSNRVKAEDASETASNATRTPEGNHQLPISSPLPDHAFPVNPTFPMDSVNFTFGDGGEFGDHSGFNGEHGGGFTFGEDFQAGGGLVDAEAWNLGIGSDLETSKQTGA